jgi:hypothetical protein
MEGAMVRLGQGILKRDAGRAATVSVLGGVLLLSPTLLLTHPPCLWLFRAASFEAFTVWLPHPPPPPPSVYWNHHVSKKFPPDPMV